MKPTKQIKPVFITYTGPSMNPTLKAGDLLRVAPYQSQRIRCGDVVVFRHPHMSCKITHRVVFVDFQGIRTCGDNNRHVDRLVLRPDHLIGRVVALRRGSREHSVWGGPIGSLLGTALRITRMTEESAVSLLHPLYERLSRSGILRRCMSDRLKPRVISLERLGGEELQLLLGHHVVGRRPPGTVRWHIRRPFRLFVDEGSLPANPPE